MNRRFACAITAALFLFIATSVAATAAPVYRVESLASKDAVEGVARAINAGGDVAGQIDGTAFVWHAGRVTRIAAERSFYLGDSFTNIATAINRDGVAAGHDGEYTPCSMSGLELASAVIYAAGKMHFVDRSRDGLCSFEVDGINDRGTIVGESGYRGFVRFEDGREVEVRPLSTRPEWNGTRASAIDNENHVVGGTTVDSPPVRQIVIGSQSTADGKYGPMYAPDVAAYPVHAFLLTLGDGQRHMRDLGALVRFPDTYATAINEDLTIVGYSGTRSGPKWTRIGGPSHAWVWQNGRMTDIGGSSGVDSFAYGVNDAGIIVGCAGANAVRWVRKRMQDLNALIDPHSGWHLTCARAINRDGVIVGTGMLGARGPLPVRLVPVSR